MIIYGHRNNHQRYKCKKCNYIYEDIPLKIRKTQKSKRVLSLLYYMLEHDFNNESNLDEAIKPTEKFDILANKTY